MSNYSNEQVKELAVRLADSMNDERDFDELPSCAQKEAFQFAKVLINSIKAFKNVMSTGEEVLLATLSAPDDYVKERYAEVIYKKWTSFHAMNYGCSFDELPKNEKLKYVRLLMALYDWLRDMRQQEKASQ